MIPIRDDNPTAGTPVVTIALIVINVLVFFAELGQGQRMQEFIWKYGYVPAELTESRTDLRRAMIEDAPLQPATDQFGNRLVDPFGRPLARRVPLPFDEATALPAWLNIFTCMFLHGGWGHLLGNMLYLWIFGNNVEDRLGPLLFLVFYLATGLVGNLAHTLFDSGVVPLVGASGAISGLMGGYLLLFPHARVLALVPAGWYWFTVKLPAWIFLGVYVVLQNAFPVLGGFVGAAGQRSAVAYLAHLGGFVGGMAFIHLFPHRPAPQQPRREISDDDADLVI